MAGLDVVMWSPGSRGRCLCWLPLCSMWKPEPIRGLFVHLAGLPLAEQIWKLGCGLLVGWGISEPV